MDKDVEMDDLNNDDSNKPLLDPPEVTVVQPDKERQRRGSDSSKESLESLPVVMVLERLKHLEEKKALERLEEDRLWPTIMFRKKETALELTEPVVAEKLIIQEKTDNVDGQNDLKEDENRLSLQDRVDFEKEMDEILEAEDLDDIKEWITPQKLTKCATNCLEKSLGVSHTLKSLADAKGPDADDLSALGKSVEDFAVQLLEPLKSDDLKRAIFEGGDFDRVLDKAVKYRQKKFVSHPVVYNLLTRQRWTGDFHKVRYGKNWFKWFLLNFWTFFDVLLFPLVHVLLWVIHLIIEFAKKRQELRVVFLFNASWKYANVQLRAMQITAEYIMQKMQSDRIQYATITRDRNGPTVKEFTSSEGAIKNMPDAKDVDHPTREISKNKDVKDDVCFLDCLEKAKNLFEKTKESKKVFVVMTDDKLGAPNNKLLKSIKEQNVKVISVGLGVHPDIKELDTMATSEENVVLIFNDDSNPDERKKTKILECINGKDIYDRYAQYFKTPYFIFFRDTLSYLALLGLHFAMCLQPSTLNFTAVEWIISVFFLGRLMMEINQLKPKQDHEAKEKPKEEEEEEQDKSNKKSQELKKIWRIISSYFDDWWNILDIFTLIVFLVLVGLRAFIWSQHSFISKNRLLAVAGYLYGLNAMFLTLRVFGHIMEYKESTGSIQIALFRIIRAVIIIFGQFVATTLAFSFAVTKIYIAEVSYSSGKNGTSIGFCKSQSGLECWWGFTRHLSWSLLGIADLTPLQSSDETSDLLAKILYGLFLIMGVVMLMNMMIALLSSTYQQVQNNAFYEWSYKKATTIRTYSKYHPVPVPFNIISLSFILLRHIYRTITSTTCCNPQKEQTYKEKMLWYRLQIEYFAKYGQKFLKTETEGNRKMIGYIAERAFLNDPKETQQPNQRNRQDNGWEEKGIAINGQRLEYAGASCSKCDKHGKVSSHSARYLSPLSKECPEFKVLIKEIGEKRIIAIGVVTAKDHNTHELPGWKGNTAGYHIDNGKIFDTGDNYYGRNRDDAMAYRGDIIGCKILYDKEEDGKLPVSFTLNNRVVGEAKVDAIHENHPGSFYPCVGIGSKGISLVFRLCPRTETEPVFQNDDISEQQSELLNNTPSMDSDSVIQMFKTISEKLQMISKRQTELERKIDHLSRTG